jgi:hypothetical protein
MNSIKFVTGPKRLIVGPKKSHGGTKYKNLNQCLGIHAVMFTHYLRIFPTLWNEAMFNQLHWMFFMLATTLWLDIKIFEEAKEYINW